MNTHTCSMYIHTADSWFSCPCTLVHTCAVHLGLGGSLGALVDTGCGAGAVVSSLVPSSMTPPLLLGAAWSLDSAMATCRRSNLLEAARICGRYLQPRPPYFSNFFTQSACAKFNKIAVHKDYCITWSHKYNRLIVVALLSTNWGRPILYLPINVCAYCWFYKV